MFFFSNFPVLVYLTGGIVGVAGQFRDWQFAAFGMYPFISCLNKSLIHLFLGKKRKPTCLQIHRHLTFSDLFMKPSG